MQLWYGICKCTHMYVHIRIHFHIYICIYRVSTIYSKDLTQYTYICTHILIHTYMVFVSIHMHIYIYTYAYTYVYTGYPPFVSIHMHIYIYTYAYTYVYTGYPPFYSEDRMQLYQTILSGKIEFPRHFKKEARDLISRLLTADL